MSNEGKEIITQEEFDALVEKEVQSQINDWGIDDADYMEYLNDLHGDVDICGYSYQAGCALRELDPTAFSVGQADMECPDNIQDDFRSIVIEEFEAEYDIEE